MTEESTAAVNQVLSWAKQYIDLATEVRECPVSDAEKAALVILDLWEAGQHENR
jgi:hypothetical protein